MSQSDKLNKWQQDVEDFHRALDIPIAKLGYVGIQRPELRSELIREESKEFRKALKRDDIVGAIDGACDLIVVTLGTVVEMGIDLEPFWDEVHRTNMAKQGGPERADGKRLKPDGWTPPNINGILHDTSTFIGGRRIK